MFGEAYDLVLLIDKFIHFHVGFQSEVCIRTSFDLARYLVGVGTNKCGDEKLYSAMLDLSRVMLQEALIKRRASGHLWGVADGGAKENGGQAGEADGATCV
jgi:hypothetical protein